MTFSVPVNFFLRRQTGTLQDRTTFFDQVSSPNTDEKTIGVSKQTIGNLYQEQFMISGDSDITRSLKAIYDNWDFVTTLGQNDSVSSHLLSIADYNALVKRDGNASLLSNTDFNRSVPTQQKPLSREEIMEMDKKLEEDMNKIQKDINKKKEIYEKIRKQLGLPPASPKDTIRRDTITRPIS